MIECPNCKNLNDEDNQFCGKCGAKLPNPKYCPRGHYHSFTDDFCTKCGEKLISKVKYDKISKKVISLRHQADDFKDKKEFDKALQCYDEILKIRPDDGLTITSKRSIYSKLGKFKEAIECCDEEIEIDSQDNFAYLFKGTYLHKLGKFEEAIKCFDKSILIDSNYHSPYIDKGVSLLELGKFNDALCCFDKAFKIKNDNPFIFSFVVSKLYDFFKFEEALNYCNMGLSYHPNDNPLINKKARLLCLRSNDDEANDFISKNNLNGARIFYSVARKLNLMGDFYKAKQYCNKSINLNSQFYHSWITMGEIYYNLEQYDESLEYFKKGFDLCSDDKEKIIKGVNKNCQDFVKSNLF